MLTKIYKILCITVLFAAMSATSFAEYFSPNSSYSICFTPEQNCAGEIIKTLAQAKKQILVQAYSFTDTDIVNALVKAKRRGIEVIVILDKSQIKAKYSPIKSLKQSGIKVLIDNKPAIAHNKIIIIDGQVVLGGSYNYTVSAAKRNAENLVIIKDENFAQPYVRNWHIRERESICIGGCGAAK